MIQVFDVEQLFAPSVPGLFSFPVTASVEISAQLARALSQRLIALVPRLAAL
jgi:hypothetical protein